MRITEYVGREGVRSSERDVTRFQRPKPGDLIRWPNGDLGRVWQTEGAGFTEAGEVHVCDSLGSAFLAPGYVDISGGPFYMLKTADLRSTFELGASPFWNWGDCLRGADQGVEYVLHRPVFEYVGDPEIPWMQKTR